MTDNHLHSDNKSKKRARKSAVAIENDPLTPDLPLISAAGRGKLAEKILDIAFENGVKVREDKELAEMLVSLELDSEIPTEAILAVAEILAHVYQADGEIPPDSDTPFQLTKHIEDK